MKLLILFFIFPVLLFSRVIEYSSVDFEKPIIQIGVYSKNSSLKIINNIDNSLDIYVNIKNDLHIVYVVNLNYSDLKDELKRLRKIVSNAFNLPNGYSLKNKIKDVEASNAQSNLESLYLKGLGYFKEKKYEDAHENFFKAFKIDNNNERINFYLGRCEYELGLYDEAVISFKNILKSKPNNARVKLEVAQTYLQMKQYDKALIYFKDVLNEEIPENVATKVKYNIAEIEKKQQKNFYNITLSLGILYESNIENSPDSGEYSIYIPEIDSSVALLNDGQKKSSISAQTSFALGDIYKFDDKKIITSSIGVFIKKYPSKYGDKDVYASFINTTPSFILDATQKVSLGIGWDHIWYGHESLMNVYNINSEYSKFLDKNLNYSLFFKVGNKKYLKEVDKNRDSLFYQIQTNLIQLTQDYGTMIYNLQYINDSEKYVQRTDVSKHEAAFSISNRYGFSENLFLNSSTSYTQVKYNDTDINFLTKRDDTKFDLSLGLIYVDDKKTVYGFKIYYMNNKSNQKPFEYDQYTLSTNVIYSF